MRVSRRLRGTYDPAYLNYTLGKLMVLKLREDWMAQQGDKASLRAFHDQFLSLSGPVPLVRRRCSATTPAAALSPARLLILSRPGNRA